MLYHYERASGIFGYGHLQPLCILPSGAFAIAVARRVTPRCSLSLNGSVPLESCLASLFPISRGDERPREAGHTSPTAHVPAT